MKVTIVSTLPVALAEEEPGLVPSVFHIPAAKKDSFSKLVFDDCYYLILGADPQAPPISIRESADGVAAAIITQVIQSQMGTLSTPNVHGDVPIPGLFFLMGDVPDADIKTKHKAELDKALRNTKAWLQNLVVLADDEWNKNRQRKTITSLQRVACNYLGLDKEWNYDSLLVKSANCWACKSNIHPEAIICPNCKAVLNQEAFTKAKAQFANA